VELRLMSAVISQMRHDLAANATLRRQSQIFR
jgi:hypothetical protein